MDTDERTDSERIQNVQDRRVKAIEWFFISVNPFPSLDSSIEEFRAADAETPKHRNTETPTCLRGLCVESLFVTQPAQISRPGNSLFNPFNSFNLGCGSAAPCPSVVNS